MSKTAKTILITGTSNGFGKDAAFTLAAAGHRVFASMRDVSGRNSASAKELQAKGIEVLELDVTDDASVEAAFKHLYTKIEKLDVLVNNAGLFAMGISETFTPEQVRNMFEVNVFGIQRVTRAALPQMRQSQSGLIVNIGSILGRVTIPFMGLYGATKFAVDAITKSYRFELSQLGIDVVNLQPSAYPTNLYHANLKAGDETRASGYGEIAQIPGKVVEFLGGMFSGSEAPNPHDVAVGLVKLVETPAGERPERVVIGASFGAVEANAAMVPIEAATISAMGMDGLAKLKV